MRSSEGSGKVHFSKQDILRAGHREKQSSQNAIPAGTRSSMDLEQGDVQNGRDVSGRVRHHFPPKNIQQQSAGDYVTVRDPTVRVFKGGFAPKRTRRLLSGLLLFVWDIKIATSW